MRCPTCREVMTRSIGDRPMPVEVPRLAALVRLIEATPGATSVRYEGDRWIASGRA